jgi:hypothetical protein
MTIEGWEKFFELAELGKNGQKRTHEIQMIYGFKWGNSKQEHLSRKNVDMC